MARQWNDLSILQELAAKVGPVEATVAGRIIEWARTRDLDIEGGKGLVNGSLALVSENGCELVTIVTTGNVMISFARIRKSLLTDDKSKVADLLTRFNQIPAVAFPDATTFRFIRLTKLKDEKALKQFLDTLAWLISGASGTASDPSLFPNEVPPGGSYREGAVYQVTVNAYERNPVARQKCIECYGASCTICGFNFGEVFGKIGEGFIHVHHLRPLSEIGKEYEVDPVADLRPVCPTSTG